MKKQAVINVAETDNLHELAEFLSGNGWELFSTGTTASQLFDDSIPYTQEDGLTDNPETTGLYTALLESVITSGHHLDIGNERQMRETSLVCINLDPLFHPLRDFTEVDASANCIDERNSALVQAAAKNYRHVIILTDPDDYQEAIIRLRTDSFTDDFRLYLAGKAFNMISAYNAAIAGSILSSIKPDEYPKFYTAPYRKLSDLKQGTNSHQTAAVYSLSDHIGATGGFKKLQGDDLTYQIYLDINAAWKQVSLFSKMLKNPPPIENTNNEGASFTTRLTPAADTVFTVALKYTIPAGAALGSNVTESCTKTLHAGTSPCTDAALGCSSVIDGSAARVIIQSPLRAVIAPGYTSEARSILASNPDLRLISATRQALNDYDSISLDGGLLIQKSDTVLFNKWRVVTKTRPSQQQADQMAFGMLIALSAKPKSAVIISGRSVASISCSRTQTVQHCIDRYINRTEKLTDTGEFTDVLVSDSELPFTDSIRQAAEHGLSAIIQTGGAPDEVEFIKFCDERSIAMVCTGIEHITI